MEGRLCVKTSNRKGSIMKGIVVLSAALLVPIAAHNAHSKTPPPPKSLGERVELATHVFVGVARKAKVVRYIAGRPIRVWREPRTLGLNDAVLLEVEVTEVLYPKSYKPRGRIRYVFGGGFFSVGDIRRDTINMKLIYLLRASGRRKKPLFHSSYSWHLAESVQRKQEIEGLLARKMKKQGRSTTHTKQSRRP